MTSEQLGPAMDRWEAGDLEGAAALFREVAATGDAQASHLLACLLEEQGDLDGAEAAHRAVIQSGDPVYGQRSAMAMGMMLINAREWPAAHRVLSIAADGADFEVAALAETAMVLVCTELGDEAGAGQALDRARRSGSPAVAELAARLRLPDFPPAGSARELYEQARDEDDYRELLTGGDPEVVSLSAFRLYRQYADEERFEEARAVCEHAVAAGHPDHLSMAYKLLGAVLVDLGEYAESVAAYARAAEDPRPEMRLPALLEQAKVIGHLGDEDRTKAIFRRVIASGQREYALEAQACLAQLHTEAGEVAEALDALRVVLTAGESEWASVSVTLLAMLLERHAEAYEEIMELVCAASRHPDPDAAFKAALLLDHDARREPLSDPVEEQALQDADEGLAQLRAGDLAEARRLLRRAADSGAGAQAVRAMMALAELELGEGDREQADELLTYVAEGEDVPQGFTAAFLLCLLERSGDEPHPVLRAVVAHQRLGREEGLARYREAMDAADPGVAAVGTAVFAQVAGSLGLDLSEAAGLLRRAAGSGDPLALSYAAVIGRDVLRERDEAADLLRRARLGGHPALAPWVAHALAGMTDELALAREAYTEALSSTHEGLRREAAAGLARVYEEQGDLLAACRLHERVIAHGGRDAVRAAWLLGLTRVRLDDLEGARAAFELVPDGAGDRASGGRVASEGQTASESRSTSGDRSASDSRSVSDVPSVSESRVASGMVSEGRDSYGELGSDAAEDRAVGFEGAAASGVVSDGRDSYGEFGRYGRALLDREFSAAGRALGGIGGEVRGLAAMLAMQSAHAWQRRGDREAADSALTLALDSGHAGVVQEAACYLGALRQESGDLAGAASAWELAAEGDDDRLAAMALRHLGAVRQSAGRHDDAASAYRRALDRDPADVRAATRLADALVAAGRLPEAHALLPAHSPHDAALHLARSLRTHGHLTEAITTLQAARARGAQPDIPLGAASGEVGTALGGEDPTPGEHVGAVGEAAPGERAAIVGEGRTGLGGDHAFGERAAVVGVLGGEGELLLGELLAQGGDSRGAWEAFERAAGGADERAAAVARARLGRASAEELPWALAALGEREAALTALAGVAGSAEMAELLLALHEDDVAEVRHLLVERPAAESYDEVLAAARGLDGEEPAEELYRMLVELGEPRVSAQARLGLGGVLAGRGEHCRAELCLLPATGDEDAAAHAWEGIGRARRARGDLDGAAEALHAAMPGSAVQLAELRRERGDGEGARAALAAGVAAGDLESLRHLLVVLLEQQAYEEVKEQAERAAGTGDQETVTMGYWAWGEACRSGGDLAGAVLMLRKAVEAGYRRAVPAVRGDLARALRALGDAAGAAEEARLAIESEDADAAAQAALDLGCWLHEDGDPLGAADAFAVAVGAGGGA
ncbi:tetratricopeptide repeat protein, partial [Nonomuraea harbinensis]